MFQRASRSVAILATLVVLHTTLPLLHADTNGRDIYRKTLHSTAFIIVPLKNGTATGTGWVVDAKNKLIVTNHHVVEENPRILCLFPLFDKEGAVKADRADYKEENGYRCKLIHIDKKKDLALIQVTDRLPDGTTELKLAARSPDPGERVHALGNPGASGALWVYTSGTVRSVYSKKWYSRSGRESIDHFSRVVETQAPINPGDSGGPIVNDEMEMIGVNSHYQVFDQGGKDVRLMSHHIDVTEVKGFVTEARRIMDPQTAADYTLKGERLIDRGQYDEAIEALTKSLKMDKKLGATYRHRSYAFCYKGDHDTAILDSDAAVALDADDAEAYQCRALANRRKGEVDKAIADYSKAIQLNPKYAIAYNNRGFAYSQKGDRVRALADYDRAIQNDDRYSFAYQNRGQMLLELSRYPEALQASDKALSINPYLSGAFENRGRALHHLKRFDDAIENYNMAIKLFPTDPGFHVERGLALTWKNDWKTAVEEYDRALQLDNTHAAAYYWKGSAYEFHGNFDKSTENYQRALNLAPKAYKEQILKMTTCYLNLKNNTDETVRVFVHVDAFDKDNGWGWYPTELGGDSIWVDVKAGQTINGLTWLANEKNWKVHGRRMRISAIGLDSKSTWNRDKDKDVWLCPKEGYLARNRMTFNYSFSK
jgi:tetratricopeptide (TPR) repeat protein